MRAYFPVFPDPSFFSLSLLRLAVSETPLGTTSQICGQRTLVNKWREGCSLGLLAAGVAVLQGGGGFCGSRQTKDIIMLHLSLSLSLSLSPGNRITFTQHCQLPVREVF